MEWKNWNKILYKSLIRRQKTPLIKKVCNVDSRHACIFEFFAGSQKKLQLAPCGSNLPTLLELVKPHNTC